MDSSQRLTYDTAILFWRVITQIFFREITPRGGSNIPRDGPVIFVGAPHNNQFLDLILNVQVYQETGRHVQFLMAAHSMKRRWIGFFARLMACIPVTRAQDEAKPGKGRISLSPDDPFVVVGHGTQFLKDLKPRMHIMLPKSLNAATAEVAEVISDTRVRLKKEFEERFDSVTEYKVLPVVDQSDMYHHVYKCLQSGGSIGIFPEGGSHDRTDLLPLKAGVSIMALGAMADDPGVKVKIVPVGLNYFHAHKFRSRAVVEFGTPLDVPEKYVEMFKQGGAQKREAVTKFLDLIYDGLKTVTVRAPDYETLMLIQAVRRLYQPPGQHLTLDQVVDLNRKLLVAYGKYKEKPRVQALQNDVLKYNSLLRNLGLRDHQVPRAQKSGWRTLGLLLYRIVLLLFWTILALPGTVLSSPILVIAKIISRKKAKEALAASTVKIAGRDVLATWKVLIALGLTPVLFLFYSIVATVMVTRANAPFKWKVLTPFATLVGLPIMNYASLKFGEAGMDVVKSLPPLIVALIPGQNRSLEKLRAMRANLAERVADLVDDLGPEVIDDFDESRIITPRTRSYGDLSSIAGLRQRKTDGAADDEGNYTDSVSKHLSI
ncbi:hypothetical protein D9613_010163 [Agrocybe pediades]|uniref:Phospholipid/glycerol acyltransferase domain-containing protein n=1 Tax=Agrocybe pediades TaxID=84607 RepID=A0A8H4VQ28_9AGAR|nr:hypothetical protein D9613_010163 [Agrocybe pediades]